MEIELRKLTFISLAQSLFDNDLKGITKDNCIEFYHYLLDGLEAKASKLLQDEDDRFLVYEAIINLFKNFPNMDDHELAEIIHYQHEVIDYVVRKTNMFRDYIQETLELIKTDAIIRMSLFLGA